MEKPCVCTHVFTGHTQKFKFPCHYCRSNISGNFEVTAAHWRQLPGQLINGKTLCACMRTCACVCLLVTFKNSSCHAHNCRSNISGNSEVTADHLRQLPATTFVADCCIALLNQKTFWSDLPHCRDDNLSQCHPAYYFATT